MNVKMCFQLLESFESEVRMNHGYVLSLVLAVMVDVTELTKEGVLSKLLYVCDLVLKRKTVDGLGNNVTHWRRFLAQMFYS